MKWRPSSVPRGVLPQTQPLCPTWLQNVSTLGLQNCHQVALSNVLMRWLLDSNKKCCLVKKFSILVTFFGCLFVQWPQMGMISFFFNVNWISQLFEFGRFVCSPTSKSFKENLVNRCSLKAYMPILCIPLKWEILPSESQKYSRLDNWVLMTREAPQCLHNYCPHLKRPDTSSDQMARRSQVVTRCCDVWAIWDSVRVSASWSAGWEDGLQNEGSTLDLDGERNPLLVFYEVCFRLITVAPALEMTLLLWIQTQDLSSWPSLDPKSPQVGVRQQL